jgi:hypothetical protein
MGRAKKITYRLFEYDNSHGARVVNHIQIRTTKRYSHAMDEAKREAVEKLASGGKSRQI